MYSLWCENIVVSFPSCLVGFVLLRNGKGGERWEGKTKGRCMVRL